MAIKGAQHGIRGRGSYNVGVRLEGDVIKFNLLTSSLSPLLAASVLSAQHDFARDYKDKVKQNIIEGGKRFHYPPHSTKYSRYKARLGGPSRLLYWSGAMANSIEIKATKDGKNFTVGIPKGENRPSYGKGDNNRLSISEYANILEHGRPPYMPARPVFSDTFREQMGGLKGLKKAIETGIILNMGKLGYRVNKV